MKRTLTLLAGAAFLAVLTASSLFANEYTVQSVSPAWQEVNNSTWVLPATIPGCGSENEPSCEPTGDFLVNVPIGGITAGYATMTEADGSISDYFVWGNTGPNGNGELLFYSDPNVPSSLPSFDYGSMCTEDPVTGCVVSESLIMGDGGILSFTLASDGESYFDPFGAGYDTSDGISFTNATTPEPCSLLLFGSFLGLVGGVLRRKLA